MNARLIDARLPAGFRAAGAFCGLKADSRQLDISLIVCDQPTVAAGVYTRNQVSAAPVVLDRQRTPSNSIRAVVANSGNANACTGEQGMRDAQQMASATAKAIGCDAEQVLVMSTGVIGQLLDMNKIAAGIHQAAEQVHADGLVAAARGIMTTDTAEKIATAEAWVADQSVRVTGIAKGSGMIAPNMATMLAVIMTDARMTPAVAQQVLREVSDRTFHCISVDGHTSTNDTVLLLASGCVGAVEFGARELPAVSTAIEQVCTELSRAIVSDGEGAGHLVEIRVTGCNTFDDARIIAKSVASSPLVKTAVAGCDPNWGRIVSAAGYAGPAFDTEGVSLAINGTLLYHHGVPVEFDEAEVSGAMHQREVLVELTFSEGDASASFWTCDLTAEYVRINADYRT